MDFVGTVTLELIVGELQLDWSFPASQAAEDLVCLGGWIIVFDLGLYFGEWLSFLGAFGCICSFLFLFIFLLLFLLLIALVVSSLLALIVGRVGNLLFFLLFKLLLRCLLQFAILLRNLHS